MTEIGWTEKEYRACPELASRLHGRILDLQDKIDRLEEQIEVLEVANERTVDVEMENGRLRSFMLLIAEKLEMPGNEEPFVVARHIRGALS